MGVEAMWESAIRTNALLGEVGFGLDGLDEGEHGRACLLGYAGVLGVQVGVQIVELFVLLKLRLVHAQGVLVLRPGLRRRADDAGQYFALYALLRHFHSLYCVSK